MLELLDDYDWREAFGYAGEPATCGTSAANVIPTLDCPDIDTSHFSREDVAEVLYSAAGENDEEPWLCVGRLTDGRYFALEAGCDYTGWDCQAGGQAYVAHSPESVLRFGLGDRARERLGVTIRGAARTLEGGQ